MSTRENIVAALVDRLRTPPAFIPIPQGLEACNIHRYALRTIEADKLPALVVYRYDNKPVDSFHLAGSAEDNLLLYEVSIRVEVRAVGEPVDQVVEEFEEYVRQVVFSDASLGGLSAGARELAYEVDGALLDKGYAASYISLGFLYYEQPYVFPATGADLQLVQVDNATLTESFTVPE